MLRDDHGIVGETVFAAAHRWRYALVESAFDSGEAMAEVIIGSEGAGHDR